MSIRRMEGRDINERHRTPTTLELLFDLIIVVAVAQAAGGLHHMLAEGMYATGAVRYMMAFWCVFIGWMNFSWFASAYDTDDVPYRITTAVQMLGAMILAAGIGDIFLHTPDLTTAFIGFVIMRLAM
jgi:low temperature requirement protein LtrA